MRSYILIFILLTSALIADAQIMVPDPVPHDVPLEISSTQKGVRTSTDIVAIALPVATLAGVLISKDWEGLKQGAFAGLTCAGAVYLLKLTVCEQRPDHTKYDSFPSGHTAACFTTAAFLQRRYGWKIGAPAYAASCYVAWGRVFSKRHHWWDVVAGAAIGAGSAYLFTTPFAKKHNLKISPVSDGRNFGVVTSLNF